MRILSIPYTTWKSVTLNNSLLVYKKQEYEQQALVWSGTRDIIFSSVVDDDLWSDFTGSFSIISSVESEDDALAQIYNQQIVKNEPICESGKKLISVFPTEGSQKTIYSPNWSDKTTWYEGSVYTASVSASNSGDNQQYNLPHNGIIDVYHGKITQEDFLVSPTGSGDYRAKIYVNDEEKIEQDPHYGTGGDYIIDYTSGTINFISELNGSDQVTADYYYADSSIWTIKPLAGKVLKINKVEVQFSTDIEITDTIIFQPYGPIDIFAPHLLGPPYNLPSGYMIPLGDAEMYKSMADYYNDANGTFPEIPPLGGDGWRGFNTSIYSFPWLYQAVRNIQSSLGLEIRIRLEHDVEFGGRSATATFYCLSEDE